MKKAFASLLCFAIAINTASCSLGLAKNNGLSETASLEEIVGVQYVRTNGYQGWMVYPYIICFTSQEDLSKYYSAFSGIFYLEKYTDMYNSMDDGWLSAIEKYNSEWFESNILLMVLKAEGSGSISHEVKGIVSYGGVNLLSVDRILPTGGTSDMALWHIMVELKNTSAIEGIMIDGRAIPRKQPVTVDAMIKLLNEFFTRSAIENLAPEEIALVIGIGSPIIERLGYADLKTREIDYFYGPFDSSRDGQTPIWRVLFHTTEDGKFGPLAIYLDSDGHAFARDIR
ncbi:MAG: hypothetical protein FWG30_06130 [Eubacteriaceae bacterium]|nr:hypothetical protein [Eubacteriaceae bacterium]